MKKRILAMLAAVLILLSGCASQSPPLHQAPAESGAPHSKQTAAAETESLTLYPAAANMPLGRELQLKAALSPIGASAQWTSSDDAVAAVSDGGRVLAKAPGTCTITVTSGGKSAECSVTVTQDGPTLIWANSQPQPDTDDPPPTEPEGTKAQPPSEGEAPEIPIEVPEDVIEVEVIPELDEFVWTILIDDRFSTPITNDGITLQANIHVKANAVKTGGKRPSGAYSGTFFCDADYDSENFLKVMNEQPEIKESGGRIVDYQENDEGSSTDFNPDLQYFNIGLTEDVFLLQAFGVLNGTSAVTGSMTMEVEGQSVTLPFGGTGANGGIYLLSVRSWGRVTLSISGLKECGAERYWVRGILCKRPML